MVENTHETFLFKTKQNINLNNCNKLRISLKHKQFNQRFGRFYTI